MVSEATTVRIKEQLRALDIAVGGLLIALEDGDLDRIRAEWEDAEVFAWEDILYEVGILYLNA